MIFFYFVMVASLLQKLIRTRISFLLFESILLILKSSEIRSLSIIYLDTLGVQ